MPSALCRIFNSSKWKAPRLSELTQLNLIWSLLTWAWKPPNIFNKMIDFSLKFEILKTEKYLQYINWRPPSLSELTPY